MGDFTITIKAVGGHGCKREAKSGDKIYGCGQMSCPDCQAREFVRLLQRTGTNVGSATLEHWPNQTPQPGPVDDLLTGIRTGSFGNS